MLSFGHSGILYKWSFVLYDRQTGSLWVQASGRAEYGPLKGRTLRLVPSTVTTWNRWKQAYPQTLVLPGAHSGWFYGRFQGIGRTQEELGQVVIVKFKGKLYPYRELSQTPVVNDTFKGTRYVVAFNRQAGTAVVWNRDFQGRTLEFEAFPGGGESQGFLLRDRQTGSIWNWLTGMAVSGSLQGGRLKKMASNPMLNIRFDGFFPAGPIFGRSTSSPAVENAAP